MFSILIGLTIYKYSNGRRITINLALILIIIPIEIVQFITQMLYSEYSSAHENLSSNFYLNAAQGIFVYTLFYQVCIFGAIDVSKVWVLRSNTKLICVFYCILFGFANIVQSLVLERFIKFAVTTK